MAWDKFSWREGLFNLVAVLLYFGTFYIVANLTVEGLFQDAVLRSQFTTAGAITAVLVFLLTGWVEGSMKGLSAIRGK